MSKPKNQKTVSAKALVAEMDALEALAREDYLKAIKAVEAIVAEVRSLQGAARAAFIKDALPQRNELSAFIKVYDDQVIPAHAAVKAAAAKDDLPAAKDEADKMLNGLEALAAINPDLATKFEAYESRFAAIETKNEQQDDEIEKLWAEIRRIHARGDYTEGYLLQATSGKGFEPYVPFGTPVVPAPVDPPQVPQDPHAITDAESLGAAAAAKTDATDERQKPRKKGVIETLRERVGLGRSNGDGDSVPFRPSQFAGPVTSNNPATAGGAH